MHSRFLNCQITAFSFFCYASSLTSRGACRCLQLSLPQNLRQQNLTQKWDNRRFVRTSRVATVVVFLVVIVGAILVFHTHDTGVGGIAGNDMVVELKGFRSRWQGHSVQPNLHESSEQPSSDDLDLSWDHVKDADTDGIFGHSNETSEILTILICNMVHKTLSVVTEVSCSQNPKLYQQSLDLSRHAVWQSKELQTNSLHVMFTPQFCS